MTPEHNQAAWIAYELARSLWKRAGSPLGREPRLPLQLGPHIDSLPVEVNEPGTVNRLMPVPRR
jgi:hypothetical protein